MYLKSGKRVKTMDIKEYKKEFEERFGAMWMAKRPQDYVDSTVSEDGEKLWNFFENKLQQVREEAYRQGATDFDMWLDEKYKIGVDAEMFLRERG